MTSSIIPAERINASILTLRGMMLDRDLAKLYGVQTKALVQAVKRNAERFPPDFMFQLSSQELESLRSQICDLKFVGWHPIRAVRFQ